MNIFNKVTIKSLKKNRTRTIVTIIGIMLSAAMICAVTTFVSSLQNYVLNYSIYTAGDWHGAVYNVDWNDYAGINTDEEVSNASYAQILGYAQIDSINEYKPYMYVYGAKQSNFFDMMPVHMISGSIPENSNEIILPEHLESNGGLKYKIGDTITLELGDRKLDGYLMWQNNPCYTYDTNNYDTVLNDEVIEVREERTYKVVGIYERPEFEEMTAPGYTAITVADKEFSDSTRFDVYFKMNKPAHIYDFMETKDLGGTQNTDLLMFSGVSRFSSFSSVLTNLAIIVIVLIMFGSISLIYNAFSISVSERTKQFGLLSSIGATKRQLKKMVFYEALAVSAIGIPSGIGVGIAGIAITLMLIGNKFASLIGNYNVPMTICISWEAIVIAVIVSLITVLISAWIPSKRATKISAVEAIRQNTDIKAKNKRIKTSKLTYKLFGIYGMLASKHYKRSKKKYAATVISLFMSIVLFVSASAFTQYLMESVEGGMGVDGYDLRFYSSKENMNEKTPDEVFSLFMSDKYVTGGAYSSSKQFNGFISKEYVTNEFIDGKKFGHVSNGVDLIKEDEDTKSLNGQIYFVNDSEFEKLIDRYNLNREDYFDENNPLAISIDNNIRFDYEKEKYVSSDVLNSDYCEITCMELKHISGYSHMGEKTDADGNRIILFQNNTDKNDILELPYDESFVEYTVKSGKTITDFPFYVAKSVLVDLNMIYPMSMAEKVLPEKYNYNYYDFYITTDNHKASFENLKSVLDENGLGDMNELIDYAAEVETSKNIVNIIQVFSYGFIVLISLIAAANVFNTISTNINLRRREFAMLKSVGMTKKGFNKMMNYECLLYGSKALVFGLPVSAGFTYLIYLAVYEGYETTYHLPWSAIAIAAVSVFAVVFATMLYSMRKIKKDNPIDALKNENL